jgi:hypothetical protein
MCECRRDMTETDRCAPAAQMMERSWRSDAARGIGSRAEQAG